MYLQNTVLCIGIMETTDGGNVPDESVICHQTSVTSSSSTVTSSSVTTTGSSAATASSSTGASITSNYDQVMYSM